MLFSVKWPEAKRSGGEGSGRLRRGGSLRSGGGAGGGGAFTGGKVNASPLTQRLALGQSYQVAGFEGGVGGGWEGGPCWSGRIWFPWGGERHVPIGGEPRTQRRWKTLNK